ncbi:MAG: DUF1499 domain-containing protein [Deltaproteobacteria bacterium]|nr:DUF1499 domain-containing protein [Deltaproteobacteria bacterium]
MSRLSVAGLLTAMVFVFLAAASGPGSRLGLWHFRTGFAILRFSAYGGLLSAALSFAGVVVCLLRRQSVKGAGVGAAGLLLSLAVVIVPLMWSLEAKRVPRIHDITTDTENPPIFKAIPETRPTPPEYPGAAVSVQQREMYPEITPLELNISPERAYEAALRSARELGWEIVDSDLSSFHIEAVDTTMWYGFKDDIAVRITPQDGGSRVDVRSVSRVGVSDVGTNARRIRRYFDAIGKKS